MGHAHPIGHHAGGRRAGRCRGRCGRRRPSGRRSAGRRRRPAAGRLRVGVPGGLAGRASPGAPSCLVVKEARPADVAVGHGPLGAGRRTAGPNRPSSGWRLGFRGSSRAAPFARDRAERRRQAARRARRAGRPGSGGSRAKVSSPPMPESATFTWRAVAWATTKVGMAEESANGSSKWSDDGGQRDRPPWAPGSPRDGRSRSAGPPCGRTGSSSKEGAARPKPMEKVAMRWLVTSRMLATTALESMPPLRKTPKGTSLSRRSRTASRSTWRTRAAASGTGSRDAGTDPPGGRAQYRWSVRRPGLPGRGVGRRELAQSRRRWIGRPACSRRPDSGGRPPSPAPGRRPGGTAGP